MCLVSFDGVNVSLVGSGNPSNLHVFELNTSSFKLIKTIDSKVFQRMKLGNRIYALESIPNIQHNGRFSSQRTNLKTKRIIAGFGSFYGKGSIAVLNQDFQIISKLEQHFSHVKCLKYIKLRFENRQVQHYLASGGGDNTIVI